MTKEEKSLLLVMTVVAMLLCVKAYFMLRHTTTIAYLWVGPPTEVDFYEERYPDNMGLLLEKGDTLLLENNVYTYYFKKLREEGETIGIALPDSLKKHLAAIVLNQ